MSDALFQEQVRPCLPTMRCIVANLRECTLTATCGCRAPTLRMFWTLWCLIKSAH